MSFGQVSNNRKVTENNNSKTDFVPHQLQYCRVRMPVSDYALDQRSVLAQAIRILQAMVDVAASDGFLRTTLRIVGAIQALKQARWHDAEPLSTLGDAFERRAVQRLARLYVNVGTKRKLPGDLLDLGCMLV